MRQTVRRWIRSWLGIADLDAQARLTYGWISDLRLDMRQLDAAARAGKAPTDPAVNADPARVLDPHLGRL
jgi:hypothetical protein